MRGIHWRSQRMRHSETVVAVFLGLDLAEQRFMNLWFHQRVYYVCKIESACVRDVNPKPGPGRRRHLGLQALLSFAASTKCCITSLHVAVVKLDPYDTRPYGTPEECHRDQKLHYNFGGLIFFVFPAALFPEAAFLPVVPDLLPAAWPLRCFALASGFPCSTRRQRH